MVAAADGTRGRVFVLHVQGMPPADIARRLDISRERVRQVLGYHPAGRRGKPGRKKGMTMWPTSYIP